MQTQYKSKLKIMWDEQTWVLSIIQLIYWVMSLSNVKSTISEYKFFDRNHSKFSSEVKEQLHTKGLGKDINYLFRGKHKINQQLFILYFLSHKANVYFNVIHFWMLNRIFSQGRCTRLYTIQMEESFTPNSYSNETTHMTSHIPFVIELFLSAVER